jgi:hypothetical protein
MPIPPQFTQITFKMLATASARELQRLFSQGVTPAMEHLRGWEFRGYNRPWFASLLGIRKFKKGFLPEEVNKGTLLGYNLSVVQNSLDEPHLFPAKAIPRRFGFYTVCEASKNGQQVLCLDYGTPPHNFILSPVRLLRDYLAQPDPANRDLLLGKAYFAIGPCQVFSNFFILERYNQGTGDMPE